MFQTKARKELADMNSKLQKFTTFLNAADGLHIQLKDVVNSELLYGFEASLANVYRIIGYPRFNVDNFVASAPNESFYWKSVHAQSSAKSIRDKCNLSLDALEEVYAILDLVMDYQKYSDLNESSDVATGRRIFRGLVTSIFGYNIPKTDYVKSSLCSYDYVVDLRMLPYPREKTLATSSASSTLSMDDSGFISHI